LKAASLIWTGLLSRFSASCAMAQLLVGCELRTFLCAAELRPRRAALRRLREREYQNGHAPVAQLDRALPSEGRGRGFESLRARQNYRKIKPIDLRSNPSDFATTL
jgi:hypothetical protein